MKVKATVRHVIRHVKCGEIFPGDMILLTSGTYLLCLQRNFDVYHRSSDVLDFNVYKPKLNLQFLDLKRNVKYWGRTHEDEGWNDAVFFPLEPRA